MLLLILGTQAKFRAREGSGLESKLTIAFTFATPDKEVPGLRSS